MCRRDRPLPIGLGKRPPPARPWRSDRSVSGELGDRDSASTSDNTLTRRFLGERNDLPAPGGTRPDGSNPRHRQRWATRSGSRCWLGRRRSATYGIELPPLGERFDRFEEGCHVVIRLLTEEVSNFQGQFFHLVDAPCAPKPLQRPHPPIMIGGQVRSEPSERWRGSPTTGTVRYPRRPSRSRLTSGGASVMSWPTAALRSGVTRRRSPPRSSWDTTQSPTKRPIVQRCGAKWVSTSGFSRSIRHAIPTTSPRPAAALAALTPDSGTRWQ